MASLESILMNSRLKAFSSPAIYPLNLSGIQGFDLCAYRLTDRPAPCLLPFYGGAGVVLGAGWLPGSHRRVVEGIPVSQSAISIIKAFKKSRDCHVARCI